jgi:hypothetical protein
MRFPEVYRSYLEEAFNRAGIPVHYVATSRAALDVGRLPHRLVRRNGRIRAIPSHDGIGDSLGVHARRFTALVGAKRMTHMATIQNLAATLWQTYSR